MNGTLPRAGVAARKTAHSVSQSIADWLAALSFNTTRQAARVQQQQTAHKSRLVAAHDTSTWLPFTRMAQQGRPRMRRPGAQELLCVWMASQHVQPWQQQAPAAAAAAAGLPSAVLDAMACLPCGIYDGQQVMTQRCPAAVITRRALATGMAPVRTREGFAPYPGEPALMPSPSGHPWLPHKPCRISMQLGMPVHAVCGAQHATLQPVQVLGMHA